MVIATGCVILDEVFAVVAGSCVRGRVEISDLGRKGCGTGMMAFIGTCVSCCFDEGVLIFTEVLAGYINDANFGGAIGDDGPLVAVLVVEDLLALDLILCSLSMASLCQ